MSETLDTVELRKARLVDVASLVPYARNSRKHSPEQITVIARSIKEFGWTVPVLTDGKSGIIAGHGRILAAQTGEAFPVPPASCMTF